MQTYAMLLQNRVIGILADQEREPWWPPDPQGNPVLAVPCGEEVALGMLYDPETGTFSEPAPEPIPPDPAPEPTQLDRIEETVKQLAAGSISEEKIIAAIAEGVNGV